MPSNWWYVTPPPLYFIANAATFPQDHCKRYAVFTTTEGEEVDSEGQVEAAERVIINARNFLKKIDDTCMEWAEEVEKARQEEEAEACGGARKRSAKTQRRQRRRPWTQWRWRQRH